MIKHSKYRLIENNWKKALQPKTLFTNMYISLHHFPFFSSFILALFLLNSFPFLVAECTFVFCVHTIEIDFFPIFSLFCLVYEESILFILFHSIPFCCSNVFFIDDDDWSWNAGCNSFVFVWFCYLFIILLLIWNAINERMKKSQNNIQKQDESPFAHKIYTRAQQNLQLITSWCIYRIGSFYYVSTTAEALFVVIIHKDIYLSIY